MNVLDWMKGTAEFMRTDRPDLYETNTDALNDLESWMEAVRSQPSTVAGIETGGFILTHNDEDGVEEWQLSKIISTCAIYKEEEECLVLGWTKGSGSMKVNINLPDISDQF